MSKPCSNVPDHVKLWVYACQGILYEVCFTAMFNYALNPDQKLMGESSIWSILTYGVGGLVNEKLVYNQLHSSNVVVRVLANLLYTYVWEYSAGFALRMGGACPWDYTQRRWNLHGLITLEYVPAWVLAGILHEQLVGLMQGLCWCEKKIGESNGPAKLTKKAN